MDLVWQPEQDDLCRHFFEGAGPIPEALHEKWAYCAQLGLLGLSIPVDFGGRGLNARNSANITREFGSICADRGLMFAIGAHLYACLMPILEHGTETQKQSLLPPLCDGTWIAANCITEREAGSDLANIQTSAVKEGATYILSGTKSYVTNGPIADLFIVYAVTDPSLGYLGTSAFVVEKSTPGIHRSEKFKKMGLVTAQVCEVTFNHCRIPAANLLGHEGQGLIIFKDSMRWERTCLSAGFLGACEDLQQKCIDRVKSRKQFGKVIGKHQSISHLIADNQILIESARWLLYRACWQMDRGEPSDKSISMAKIAISEAFVKVGTDAIQVFGGEGYKVATGIEEYTRDAIGTKIFSGTIEIQKNIIAAELGL